MLQDALGQLGPNVDFECARLAPGSGWIGESDHRRVGVCHRETRNSRNSDGRFGSHLAGDFGGCNTLRLLGSVGLVNRYEMLQPCLVKEKH